jgi:hypothetical protein
MARHTSAADDGFFQFEYFDDFGNATNVRIFAVFMPPRDL